MGKTCKDVPKDGFICPESLPDLPEWNLAKRECKTGCYLFPPKKARAAKFDSERAELSEQRKLLVEDLRLNIKDLRLNLTDTQLLLKEVQDQRDGFKTDVTTLKGAVAERDRYIEDLQKQLDASYDLGDMAVSFGAGAGIALLAGLITVLVVAVK